LGYFSNPEELIRIEDKHSLSCRRHGGYCIWDFLNNGVTETKYSDDSSRITTASDRQQIGKKLCRGSFGGKADIPSTRVDVRLWPKADIPERCFDHFQPAGLTRYDALS